jgi:hypothetical protein
LDLSTQTAHHLERVGTLRHNYPDWSELEPGTHLACQHDIDAYDAVIGYRIVRRDHWMRKLNAWGWNRLVSLALGVSVHDLDCAFKLLHTDFLQQYALETGGAMVNAELLYKLKLAGGTYKEMGVRHLPRRTGQATGANPKVILRAFRDLLAYTARWSREEQQYRKQHGRHNIQPHSRHFVV